MTVNYGVNFEKTQTQSADWSIEQFVCCTASITNINTKNLVYVTPKK